MTRTWHTTGDILLEHTDVEIRQVYVWLTTSDTKIVIVSKDGKAWQQPGGHPEQDEEPFETAVREVLEETGVEILKDSLQLFGYYYIQDSTGTFLQLRMRCELPQHSDELELKSHIDDDINIVEAVPVPMLKQRLPWVEPNGELGGYDPTTVPADPSEPAH